MANGRLGSAEATTSWAVLYTCPSNKIATVTVIVCNKHTAAVDFDIALLSAVPSPLSVADADIIYNAAALSEDTTFFTSTFFLGENQAIAIKAATGSVVTMMVNGGEEDE